MEKQQQLWMTSFVVYDVTKFANILTIQLESVSELVKMYSTWSPKCDTTIIKIQILKVENGKSHSFL